jgi:hypothetical protein
MDRAAHRQGDGHYGSLAFATIDVHGPVVYVRHVLHDGETKPDGLSM